MLLECQELTLTLINADSETKFLKVRNLKRIEALEHLGV